jgi:hypothetical protein
MFLIASLLCLSPFLALYLWLINRAIVTVPQEVQRISPHRWTEKEMKETYSRIEEASLDFTPHLPPKLDRRYIVVGSSGKQLQPPSTNII